MPDPSTDRKLEITLLQERSSGTFARVYMARARAPDGLTRIVAVKVLREKWANTTEVLSRTKDEAQLLARLQHPNILRVEAITEIDGQPSIVMEYVHGADLGQILSYLGEREQHFPFRTVYEIAERITGALAAAYFKVPVGMREPLRVVHRDIKPSNIMISAEGALKVLDFGTARFDDVNRAARTEAIRFGSLKYMSSERREGERGDHSSDVYGLGLLLLELLHGASLPTLPMERADHDAEIRRRIDVLVELGLPNEGWDASLRQTITRMLHYDATQRLDAPQCVKLFRAFKEQAEGDSLGAFAEQVVGPMAGNIFAAPEDGDDGNLSGARFELAEPSDGFPSMEPEPPTETAAPRSPASASLRDLETQALPRGEAEPIGIRATTDVGSMAPEPGYAFGNLSIDEVQALPPHEGADLFRSATGALEGTPSEIATDPRVLSEETITHEAVARRPAPPAAPPTHPASASPDPNRSGLGSTWLYAGIGCIAVSVLIGIGSAIAWFMVGTPQEISPRAAQADNPAIDIVAGTDPAAAAGAMVTLQAGDPTVQWIRLIDGDGTTRIHARPDGAATVPTGEYSLRVKVVARLMLKSALSIKEDTTLRCKPATMGHVRCVDDKGTTRVVLKP